MSKDTSAPTPPIAPVPDLPQDLRDKFKAVQLLATTYNFLDRMPHVRAERAVLDQCAKFIHELYENVLAEAHAHPDADKIPDLKALRHVVAVNNGEAATIFEAEKLEKAREKRSKKVEKLTSMKKGKANGKRKA